jgi:hypothetical protein
MNEEKIQKTVGVYERPEKKPVPWAVVAIAAVIVAIAIVVFVL